MGITLDELKIIADKKKLNIIILEKDYLVTYLLYLIKDIKNIYFKGGTALNKIFLNHKRLSEDLDFTVTEDIPKIEEKIKNKLKGTIFNKISHDKRVDNFTRLVVHYKLFHENGVIYIDLNKRAKIYLKTEEHELKHFYKDYIPKFKVKTLNVKELIAEKITAIVLRYAPRDYYDFYNIVNKKLPIDMKLVKKKFKDNNEEYDINRILKRGDKIYNKWESDLLPLISTKVSFKKVIETLKRFFQYRS